MESRESQTSHETLLTHDMRHRLMLVVLLYLVLVHQRVWQTHILVLSTSGSKTQVVPQRAIVAHSVTMMVSVVIMNHVTVVIVSMVAQMIKISVGSLLQELRWSVQKIRITQRRH